jgi:hypothetical protein
MVASRKNPIAHVKCQLASSRRVGLEIQMKCMETKSFKGGFGIPYYHVSDVVINIFVGRDGFSVLANVSRTYCLYLVVPGTLKIPKWGHNLH